MRSPKLLLATAAALALVGAPAAHAQAPVPDSCIGTALNDPAGDAINGLGAPAPDFGDASPAVDVTSVFFTQKAGKSYVNIQVADLSTEITTPWFSHWYMVMFKAGSDEIKRIDVIVDQRGEPIYTHGVDSTDETDVGTSYRGDTTGTFYEGPNGVIEVELPAEAMGIAGKKLTGVSAEVRVSTRPATVTPGPVGARWVGPIADEGNGKGTFDVGLPCTAAPAAPAEDPIDVPTVQTPPASQPAAPAAAGAPAAAAAPAPAKPAAAKPSCKAKAKKIKNKRKRAAALKRCKKAAKKK